MAHAFHETSSGFREGVRHGDVLFVGDETGFQRALAPGRVAPMPPWWHSGCRLPSPDGE